MVCAGRLILSVPFSPREVNIDTLPPGTVDDFLKREHNSMIYPESVDGDEGTTFS